MNVVRVRIAPSPTGIPHIGNTRTALFNFLFAKKNHGVFILRIEDTDRARLVPESIEAIYEILEWLGFAWDEKYIQSERLTIYTEHAKRLLDKKRAYQDNGAIRFRMPKDGKTQWTDEIGKKAISFDNSSQEDFIIIKSDGYPTYNFAHVVDDHLMKISHVIRGDEFISSTPKHIQLYKAFEWTVPLFAHLPVIVGHDRQKLSKRHGAKSVLDYREEGYLKEALINFMALLGWNPGGDEEIVSLDDMTGSFDLKNVNTASPIFDIKKLEWMNGVYIRRMPVGELKTRLLAKPDPALQDKPQILERNPKLKEIEEQVFDKLVVIAQSRMKTLNDFSSFVEPYVHGSPMQLTDSDKKIKEHLLSRLSSLAAWDKQGILEVCKKIVQEENSTMKSLYMIVTGKDSGLPMPEVFEAFGKEYIVSHLRKSNT